MQWTVQVIVVLLNVVWIVFFLQPDPLSVFVQRRSSNSSDEEMRFGEFCIRPQSDTTKPKAEECRTQADIAFLLDGSGSVSPDDFQRMKKFVKDVIRTFKGNNTKFAIVQFSSRFITHYYFDTFDANNGETQIDRIRQLTGGTYTATAIRGVVQDVFTPTRGSRSNVKVLIVITDGESQERNRLPAAADLAENNNIVRFVIGVGGAFSNPGAKQELDTIASSPPGEHVFQAENFEALENIRQNLENKTKELCQETLRSMQDNGGMKPSSSSG